MKIKSLLFSVATLAALTLNANTFGLVYEGAITKNLKGEVHIKSVSYMLNGNEISANIYLPPNFDPTNKHPAIVVAHPNGGVKEQVAGLYAQRLASNGFVTIVADASFQGASGGEPRNVDIPTNRTEDIRGMADFISLHVGVDSEKISLLGICGGGGYALNAAKSDKRFISVATISMFNTGRVRKEGYMQNAIETTQQRLKEVSQARSRELKSGVVEYTGEVDFDRLSDESIALISNDLYREGMEYYGKTHRHKNSTFRYTTTSLMDLMIWDAMDNIELISVPLLLIAGEKADSLYMSQEAYQKASTQKELYLIPNATHIQTYHVKEYVDDAVKKLVEFYAKNSQ